MPIDIVSEICKYASISTLGRIFQLSRLHAALKTPKLFRELLLRDFGPQRDDIPDEDVIETYKMICAWERIDYVKIPHTDEYGHRFFLRCFCFCA